MPGNIPATESWKLSHECGERLDAAVEGLPGDDGRAGIIHSYGRKPEFGVMAPDQGTRVDLVGKYEAKARLAPALAGWTGHVSGVQLLNNLSKSLAAQHPIEIGSDHAGLIYRSPGVNREVSN